MLTLLQKKPYIFLFLLSIICYLAANHIVPITDPSESNYALTAREMVEAGNWMSPQIYGKYWYDKPIFFYWELALSFSLFGFNEFAARLPAAIFGTASVLLTYWFAARVYDKKTGLFAALILCASLEHWYLSKAVITDAALFLFMSATVVSFYLGYTENKKYYWLCYIFAGFAALTKGPIGLLLPGLACFLFLVSEKDLKEMLRVHLFTGLLLFILVAGSWYGYMYDHHGNDFLINFFGVHNYLRATVAEHTRDNVWYFYLFVFFLGFFPWSFALPISLWKRRARLRFTGMSDATRLLLIWAVTVFVVFNLFATKYLTYTYPYLFALAILTARLWRETSGKAILAAAVSVLSLYTVLAFFVVPGQVEKFTGKPLAAYMETHASPDTTILFFGDYSAGAVFYTGRTMYSLEKREEIAETRPGTISWNAKNVYPTLAVEDMDDAKHYIIFVFYKAEKKFLTLFPEHWKQTAAIGDYRVYERI